MTQNRYPRRPPQPIAQNTIRIAVDALDAHPVKADNAQHRLIAAVTRYGVTHPITVKPTKTGRFTVLDGHRRTAAARTVGIPALDCILADEVPLPRFSDNLFTRAEQLDALIRANGWTQAEAAHRLGIAQSTVANRLRLLRFAPGEREMITAAGLTERHARAILALPPEKRREILARIRDDGLTVAQTDAWIDTLRRPKRHLPTRGAIRDIGIFYNSIDRALDMLHKSGVSATLDRAETRDAVTVTIHVSRETAG